MQYGSAVRVVGSIAVVDVRSVRGLGGGAKHSFTRPGVELLGRDAGIEYEQISDQRSWQAMLDLFDEVFRGSRGARVVAYPWGRATGDYEQLRDSGSLPKNLDLW